MAKVSPRFLAAILLATILAGCAQVGAPVPPSLELPKPVNDVRATRKGEKVLLTWTAPTKITDGETIRHLGPTRVCRSLQVPMKQCDTVVKDIPPTAGMGAVSYSDQILASLLSPEADALAGYAVEVLNSEGRSAGLSNQTVVPLFPTLPPPQKLTAQVTPQGVLLQWEGQANVPQASALEFRLRIYRRDENGKTESRVGELGLRDQPRVFDQGMEWEHAYFYRATFVSISSSKGDLEVEGDDSPEVKVFVHDVFPPVAPSGLQAVFSSVGQPNFIDLTWSPNTEAELAGYNIYRREERGEAVEINSELAKIPTYRDRDIQPGKKYFYSVAAVDLRGNESAHSDEASESVPTSP
jgi:hypothetical protein